MHPEPSHLIHRSPSERGFATLALVVVLVPLLFVVGSYLQTMSGRQSRLQLEILEEHALLDAESGVDVALFQARLGTLAAGHNVVKTFTGTLRNSGRYSAVCTYLGDDDIDNDGDGLIDETDENCYRVVSTGTRQTSRRRIAAYLGFINYLPALNAAVTLANPRTTIDIGGNGMADGDNRTLNGTLTGANDGYGIAVVPPGTISNLTAQVTATEGLHVTGLGATPSLGVAAAINVPLIASYVKNAASVVLTNPKVAGNIGSAASPVIAYRQGDLLLTDNTVGHGVLVVDGPLRITGNARWNGIVVVTGNVECNGNFALYGALLGGPATSLLKVRGTVDLNFSTAGIALAAGLMGRFSAFNGWQEISTNN